MIMKVFLIAGARPNFMKIAPIHREALKYADVNCEIVHTGQRAEDRGQRTEGGGRRTDDRGRLTDDGGRRAEGRGRRTEGG